jgi:hypothetical protein
MGTKSFKEIKAWQLAHEFVLEVYELTNEYLHPVKSFL